MNQQLKVLHITAHLGGGVGKALSGLVQSASDISHIIVCLERPEKLQFVKKIKDSGTDVILAPSQLELKTLINDADIVQVEWWGHPALMATLCASTPLPAMRLLLWCHVSGLHTPIIPKALIQATHKCLFTSPCSLEMDNVQSLSSEEKNRLGIIYSAGGIDELPTPTFNSKEPLSAGYIGSLNFAKLHPDFVNFLAQIPLPDFRVKMIGDLTNKEILERQGQEAGFAGIFDFRGYCSDIVRELTTINIMPYILNPVHYGTTENALLEAMAMGIVPIVLDNPAEKCLIKHKQTGLIIQNPYEFGKAVAWLQEHPEERVRIGQTASETVRKRFMTTSMQKSFSTCYKDLLFLEKKLISFRDILGHEPPLWFLSLQQDPDFFESGKDKLPRHDDFSLYGLIEQSKGSVFHYSRFFPQDSRLKQWKKQFTHLQTSLNRNIR